MATTRLGQIGVGVQPYGTFDPKTGGEGETPHNPGLITRLGQFGVGLAKYGTFLPKTEAEPEPSPSGQNDLSGGRRRRARGRSAQDYERERRMVEEYLRELEKRERRSESAPEEKLEEPIEAPVITVPRLTDAMARAASEQQLSAIMASASAADLDRERAFEEQRRRALTAVLLLALD